MNLLSARPGLAAPTSNSSTATCAGSRRGLAADVLASPGAAASATCDLPAAPNAAPGDRFDDRASARDHARGRSCARHGPARRQSWRLSTCPRGRRFFAAGDPAAGDPALAVWGPRFPHRGRLLPAGDPAAGDPALAVWGPRFPHPGRLLPSRRPPGRSSPSGGIDHITRQARARGGLARLAGHAAPHVRPGCCWRRPRSALHRVYLGHARTGTAAPCLNSQETLP